MSAHRVKSPLTINEMRTPNNTWGVHVSQLRSWVKEFAKDPQYAFPGNGQMKPEQLEIARLKHEVIKLKAGRDILKKPRPTSSPVNNG